MQVTWSPGPRLTLQTVQLTNLTKEECYDYETEELKNASFLLPDC
jgi:hypothetical protein